MNRDPWKVSRVAYNVAVSQGADAHDMWQDGSEVRAGISNDVYNDYREVLMAFASIADELGRQVNNVDPSDPNDPVKESLQMLWEICNSVSGDEDIKRVLGK